MSVVAMDGRPQSAICTAGWAVDILKLDDVGHAMVAVRSSLRWPKDVLHHIETELHTSHFRGIAE
jgi:hypothetical protein